MVSPGSARTVHLHSPLVPRPPAPPPAAVPGDSPLGKSKLDMSPLEPLKVPPHVSSAASHQEQSHQEKERTEIQFLDYFRSISQRDGHTTGIKLLYMYLHEHYFFHLFHVFYALICLYLSEGHVKRSYCS